MLSLEIINQRQLSMGIASCTLKSGSRKNSPVWRVLAISRVGDRLLRFLAVGHGVSGSAEWDWRWRAA